MKENIVKIQGFAIAVIAFVVGLAMMSGDSTLTTPMIRNILPIPNYLSFLCILLCLVADNKTFKVSSLLIVLFLFYWILQTFHTYYKYSPPILQFSIVLLFLFSCICTKSLQYGYKVYKVFLVLMTIGGIVAYLSYIFSIGLPYSIEPYYSRDGLTGWSYINYKFAYIVLDFRGLRLCGLFNEPGLFGTILALVLIADKLNYKKIDNIVLFIGGILSFSLAFFLLIFIAILLILLQRVIKPKYIVYCILTIIVIAIALPVLVEKNEMVAYLVDRMNFEDGVLAGDNRTNDVFDWYFQQMFSDGKFLFGYGHGFNSFTEAGGLSYKKVVIEYGIIGVTILWGLLLAEALKRNKHNKMGLMFIICFFASIYQRPSVLSLNYFLILFGGIAYIHSLTEKDVNNDSVVMKKKHEKINYSKVIFDKLIGQ